LISDLWDNPELILNGIKHFRYLGHEVIIFHIWDSMEFTLREDKKVEFVDLESDEKIKLDVRQMKDEYKKLTEQYSEKLKRFCGENNVDYNLITTDTDLRYALMKYLIKRNKLY
jgi:peroxiredoxin family protein